MWLKTVNDNVYKVHSIVDFLEPMLYSLTYNCILLVDFFGTKYIITEMSCFLLFPIIFNTVLG